MFKKLFFTAAAAAAVSVPLAGAAWAEPADSTRVRLITESATGVCQQRLGDFAATRCHTPLGLESNDPIPPGQEFNLAKDLFQIGPGESTPDAIRDFEALMIFGQPRVLVNGTDTIVIIEHYPDDWENITPGLAIKPFTKGCGKGRTRTTRQRRRGASPKKHNVRRPHPAPGVRAVPGPMSRTPRPTRIGLPPK